MASALYVPDRPSGATPLVRPSTWPAGGFTPGPSTWRTSLQ